MRTIFILGLVLTVGNLYADDFLAGDAAAGKKLVQKDCMSCHDTKVYTRKNRIQSLGGLQKGFRDAAG